MQWGSGPKGPKCRYASLPAFGSGNAHLAPLDWRPPEQHAPRGSRGFNGDSAAQNSNAGGPADLRRLRGRVRQRAGGRRCRFVASNILCQTARVPTTDAPVSSSSGSQRVTCIWMNDGRKLTVQKCKVPLVTSKVDHSLCKVTSTRSAARRSTSAHSVMLGRAARSLRPASKARWNSSSQTSFESTRCLATPVCPFQIVGGVFNPAEKTPRKASCSPSSSPSSSIRPPRRSQRNRCCCVGTQNAQTENEKRSGTSRHRRVGPNLRGTKPG